MLKLLRNFGHLVKNLGIDFLDMDSRIRDEIEKYLSIYCSGSLERFFFVCRDWSVCFENIQKPLKMLKALHIETRSDGERNRVQFMNARNLPNLQHLYIYFVNVIAQREKIHHENIEDLSIVCFRGTNPFPFSFETVKHLTLHAKIEVDDAFCELIGNAKHLKTLKLNSCHSTWSSDSLDKLLDLQNIVLNVEELQFALKLEISRKMAIDTITRFLKQSRNLRKMKFHTVACFNTYDTNAVGVWFKKLSSTLSGEWKSYNYDTNYGGLPCKFYVIERKVT